ncbi:MAG TPA: hypothetical protein VHF50_01645 [Solirubrobacterales bacterium]|nr:hypothetical protein [Solirubrobacterales bacterium]
MKTLQVEVPDALAERIRRLVESGWFFSEDEIGRLALIEFVRRHEFELQEKFQRDDIAWAVERAGRPD